MHGSRYSTPTMTAPAAAQLGNTPGSNVTGTSSDFDHGVIIAVITILLVYVVWAFVALHERVRSSVQPKNISINLWNLGVITLTVVVGLSFSKILFGKLAAWGVPGSAHILAVLAAT